MSLRKLPANSNDPTSPRMFIDDTTGNIQAEGTVVSDTAHIVEQVIPGDGAISVKAGAVILTKGTVAAITIPSPKVGLQSAGGDDGRVLYIVNQTGLAHVVTAASNGLNGNKTTLTFTAATVGIAILVAYNGKWYVSVSSGALA